MKGLLERKSTEHNDGVDEEGLSGGNYTNTLCLNDERSFVQKIEQQILQAERTVQRPESEKALGCPKNILTDHQQALYRMRERKVAGNGVGGRMGIRLRWTPMGHVKEFRL